MLVKSSLGLKTSLTSPVMLLPQSTISNVCREGRASKHSLKESMCEAGSSVTSLLRGEVKQDQG